MKRILAHIKVLDVDSGKTYEGDSVDALGCLKTPYYSEALIMKDVNYDTGVLELSWPKLTLESGKHAFVEKHNYHLNIDIDYQMIDDGIPCNKDTLYIELKPLGTNEENYILPYKLGAKTPDDYFYQVEVVKLNNEEVTLRVKGLDYVVKLHKNAIHKDLEYFTTGNPNDPYDTKGTEIIMTLKRKNTGMAKSENRDSVLQKEPVKNEPEIIEEAQEEAYDEDYEDNEYFMLYIELDLIRPKKDKEMYSFNATYVQFIDVEYSYIPYFENIIKVNNFDLLREIATLEFNFGDKKEIHDLKANDSVNVGFSFTNEKGIHQNGTVRVSLAKHRLIDDKVNGKLLFRLLETNRLTGKKIRELKSKIKNPNLISDEKQMVDLDGFYYFSPFAWCSDERFMIVLVSEEKDSSTYFIRVSEDRPFVESAKFLNRGEEILSEVTVSLELKDE